MRKAPQCKCNRIKISILIQGGHGRVFKLHTNTDDVDRTRLNETMTQIGRLWHGGRKCSLNKININYNINLNIDIYIYMWRWRYWVLAHVWATVHVYVLPCMYATQGHCVGVMLIYKE